MHSHSLCDSFWAGLKRLTNVSLLPCLVEIFGIRKHLLVLEGSNWKTVWFVEEVMIA